MGCIIQMDVTIKNVCPGKRVALAAILTEVDEHGMEYQRGMKALTIPAHSYAWDLPRRIGPVHQVCSAGRPRCLDRHTGRYVFIPATSKPGSSPTRWIPIIAAVNRLPLCKAEKHYAPAAL